MKSVLARKGFMALAIATLALGLMGVLGCASLPEDQISVYSREDGSGTRGAFVELFDLEEERPNGKTVDMTTDYAAITNSTAVMMTSVAQDENAIGYISLGSLNDSVSAMAIDGVEATTTHVKSGDYKVWRPFTIVVSGDLSPAAQEFIDFILSTEGQAVVEDCGYIAAEEDTRPFLTQEVPGKVVVAGSSSVAPVMEKLAEAYAEVNPNCSVEVQQSDSTTGINMVLEGVADIGLASRELKDSELAAGASGVVIAKDGIAIIVPPASEVKNLTSQQVKSIFSGEVSTWTDMMGQSNE